MISRFLMLCLLVTALPVLASSSLADRRHDFRIALEKAERGQSVAGDERRRLLDHPLFPYIEYAELRRNLGKATPAEIADYRRRHRGIAILARLRSQWLGELARREAWPQFVAEWRPQSDPALVCHHARARLEVAPDEQAWAMAESLWRTGGSAHAACDPVFARLQSAGRLTTALRWERIELAATAGNTGLMRFVARGLDPAAQKQVDAFARFVGEGDGNPAQWPAEGRSARIAAAGIERLARRDADRAERVVEASSSLLARDSAALGRARHAVALWSAASYHEQAAARLGRVPDAAYDARLHEWRVREALAREQWQDAAKALAGMPEAQRTEPRWRYVGARLAQIGGQAENARAEFLNLAREAHYHGFLAADQVRAPYALCPLETSQVAAVRNEVAALPALQRALELHALGRPGWAMAEWQRLHSSLDPERRRIAVELAVQAGWTDRAVFDLASGDDMRHYRLRFPLAHSRHLTNEATQRGLDPAWVAALIRAESAWNPQARSHADARGLMQLLPGTAAEQARRLGLPWSGPATLYQAQTNITLGTSYLADMLARKTQHPYLATAAYNAGPAPVARWRRQRPPSEVDLWIETIPFKETRDYVVRVMAFSVIYDWRLGRDAYPLSARLLSQADGSAQRRPFHCPSPPALAITSP